LFLAFLACDGVLPWPVPVPDEAGADVRVLVIVDAASIDVIVHDLGAPPPPDAALDAPPIVVDAGVDARAVVFDQTGKW
jgi:hypothetical protein